MSNSRAIDFITSVIDEMKNTKIENIAKTAIHFEASQIGLIQNVTIKNCSSGFIISNVKVESLTQSTFQNLGGSSWLYGGALDVRYSNVTVTNSTFSHNTAGSGAAIALRCSVAKQ